MNSRRELIAANLTYFLDNLREDSVKSKIEEIRETLIECLLDDGTIYSIVYSLRDLQMMRERRLFEDRQNQLTSLTEPQRAEKAKEFDANIITVIDEMVKEQQSTLCCSGVPFFKVTDDRNEIKIQMTIIKFILSLTGIFEKENSNTNCDVALNMDTS